MRLRNQLLEFPLILFSALYSLLYCLIHMLHPYLLYYEQPSGREVDCWFEDSPRSFDYNWAPLELDCFDHFPAASRKFL
jgi:hypothetical protein